MKIDELQEKVGQLKLQKQQLAERATVVNALLPVSNQLQTIIKDKVETNKMLFFQQLVDGIEKKLNQNGDIIDAINSQTELLKDKNSQKIVAEIKNLLEVVSEMGKKTYFDQNEFNSVFTQGIEKIANLLMTPDEVPTETTYTRRLDGKIVRVVEKYNGFTLEHNWLYDSNDELIKVKTDRK